MDGTKLIGESMLSVDEIHEVHISHWKKGYGSISSKEAHFIQGVISSYRPGNFLEIGTASGMSTGFIAKFMDSCQGNKLVSIDLDKTFYVDRSKPTGFLAKEIYDGNSVNIELIQGKDSTYVIEAYCDQKFDVAFIDANHQHPWPTLDMIAILPALNNNAPIIHHDLALYRQQNPVCGIGPKYLYDQIPEKQRVLTDGPQKNIYYIKTGEDFRDLENYLADSLRIPWSIMNEISQDSLGRFRRIIERYWGAALLDAFDDSVIKFNNKV